MFVSVRHFIFRKEHSLELGYKFLPVFYGITLSCLGFFVIYKGSPGLGLDKLPMWLIWTAVIGTAVITFLVAYFFVMPLLRKHIEKKFGDQETLMVLEGELEKPDENIQAWPLYMMENEDVKGSADTSADHLNEQSALLPKSKDAASPAKDLHQHSEVFDPRTEELFSFLQVLTASVGGTQHNIHTAHIQ